MHCPETTGSRSRETLWGQRHSTLTQITPANVSGVKLAWHVKLTAPNVGDPLLTFTSEAPELEYQGTLFAEDQFGRIAREERGHRSSAVVLRPA